ncbi:MAG: FKBP-type peptidyl-prolyl cis-trans isomerase FklB [Chthoniobacter sp.]|jgi:FKBP-type peptidyl-prolyl cis-trans isomerase|nr:FKBP-type peptidyl-prolyl cis-trans isomerase FklB [Chthoniobacter sp.]
MIAPRAAVPYGPALMKLVSLHLLGVAALILAPLTSMAITPIEKGEQYLKENAGKEGVKTTATGLQYKHLKEGTGKSPKASNTVKVHYRGTLLDGTEFDSSYKRHEPIEFPLGGVIRGWTEGLQLMKEGGKTILYIPSKLAYGERGTPGGPIGPNETLIFEIELLEVK